MKLNTIIKFILLLLISLTLIQAQGQSTGEEYRQAIEQADEYFEKGDFINAKASYQYASKLQPDEEYPKEKLAESIELIKVQLEKSQQYAQKTILADDLFNEGSYEAARKMYEQALEILPNEEYALEKIDEIERILKERREIEEGYAKSVAEGDEFFINEDYEKALDAYKMAATFKPGEKYPAEKIEETETILDSLRASEDEYENALSLAEEFVGREKYDEALVQLNKAIKIKPGEAFPAKRLEEVKLLKKEYDSYTSIIEEADQLYISKEFLKAKEKYEEVLKTHPDDDYVLNMIDRTELAMAEIEDLNRSSYELAIEKADELFSEEDYENALKEYKKALSFKPGAEYALKRIDKVNELANLRKTQEEAYKQTIAKADQLYKDEKYTESREEYVKARELKPLEQYPEVKISEIDDILEQLKSREETYEALIAGADKLFYADDYEEAREQYRKASEMFPAKQYPLDQITMINEIIGLRDTYIKELTRADRLLAEEKYEEAILAYRQAAEIDPEENYPDEKINEIESLLAERAKELDNKYKELIAKADSEFESRDYEAASATYRAASEIKPDEPYPKEKIELIDKNLFEIARQQEADQQYEDAMATGGMRIREKKYQEALAAYKLAAELKPDEQEPKDKIEETNELIAEKNRQEAVDLKYNPLVAEADQLFSDKKYKEALVKYKQARELKPEEEYPRERITVTEGIIAELELMAELETEYNDFILSADSAFEANDLELARTLYSQAAALMPEKAYPGQKIDEIERKLADAEELEESYNTALALGEQYLDSQEYGEALEQYRIASELKPDAELPATKLDEINSILDEIARNEQIKNEYEDIIAEADKAYNENRYEEAIELYREAAKVIPDKIYPQEMIREIEIIRDEIAVEEERQRRYDKLIKSADSLLTIENYGLALTSYKEALDLKPDEAYAARKVTELEETIAEIARENELNTRYEETIAAADEAFDATEYDKAMEKYRSASEIKPGETYPGEKISEINRILEDIAKAEAKQQQYDQAIARADELAGSSKYEEALAEYKAAQALKPDEDYPAGKIREMNTILEDIARKEEIQRKYDMAVSNGDSLLGAGQFRAAITSFNVATELKPDEQYPKEKILESQRKLDEIAAAKALEEEYNEAVALADSYVDQALYESAINNYKKALELKPEEQYPKNKITELETLLAANTEYEEAISFADDHFKRRDWENATLEYKRANSIKPGESYPLDRIAEIESLIAEEKRLKKIEEDYRKVIKEADKLYASEEFQPALEAYRQALEIKPEETYPVTRIEVIKEKLEILEEQKEKAYELAIAKADNFFEQENYEMAKLNYETASDLKPRETYPVDRLKEVNEMIMLRRQVLQEEYDKAIADADKFYASKIYDNAIESYREAAMIKSDEAYPVEMIRNIMKLLSERAIVDVNREPLLIENNTTEKFTFPPVPVQNRKSNYIFFKATNKSENDYKVILSFGEGSAKNGGVVVKVPPGSEENEFLVRISAQYKWFSEDNNWITLYPEGGDLELGLMQISNSD